MEISHNTYQSHNGIRLNLSKEAKTTIMIKCNTLITP